MLLMAIGSEVQAQGARGSGPGEYLGGISVGRVWESDLADGPALHGYRVGFVALSQGRHSRYGFAGSWYVEWKESRSQEILEGGLEVAYPYFAFSRIALGPRIRLAIQRRAEQPSRGTDAVFGAGVEFGAWVSRRVQLAVLADRSVGLEARARTSCSVNMRIMLWAD